MSDRLSSVEIEDVLSSIRRLVSDDLRPKAEPELPPVAPKLLLTPSLRVVQDVPEAPFVAVPDSHHGIEDTVAVIGAAVSQDGYEPETGDVLGTVPAWPESTWSETTWPESTWSESTWAEPDAQPMVSGAMKGPEEAQVDAPAQALDDAAMAAWADGAEADVVAMLEADDRVFPQGATFDEDVLRDLVRDLIREELQGALGERITRNVRKLVRSELNRVLAVTDFE